MSVGLSLVDQLLEREGGATIKNRVTEAVLMVDKYGSREWGFDVGRFRVQLDFVTRLVTVTHESGQSDQTSLDSFLRRLQIPY